MIKLNNAKMTKFRLSDFKVPRLNSKKPWDQKMKKLSLRTPTAIVIIALFFFFKRTQAPQYFTETFRSGTSRRRQRHGNRQRP
jgi:hypothetical protein